MNLRQLRTFVLIAEHGSIRAAARALHLTQPAAAQPARAGAKPGRRAGAPQPQGRGADRLRPGAVQARRADPAGNAPRPGRIGQMKDGAGGSLHLAVSSSALTVLPGALRDFRQRMPRVSVSFNEVAPPHSHELLESGHYDLLVQTEYGGQIDDGFTRATLYDLPLAVGARRPSAAPRAAAWPSCTTRSGWYRATSSRRPTCCAWPMPPMACRRPRCDPLPVHRRGPGPDRRKRRAGHLRARPVRASTAAAPCAWCRWTTRCPPRVCIVMRADSPPTPAAQCFMDCLHAARRDMKMSTIAPVVNASSSKIPAKPPEATRGHQE